MTHLGRDPLALSARMRPRRARFGIVLFAAVASLGLTGCRSRDVYQASELPANLQAAHIDNPKTLDFSRMANPNSNNALIDSGDILEVHILIGLNPKDNPPLMQPRVNEAGFIALPNVGEIPVRGLDLETAESAITAACIQRKIYNAPQVTVSMRKQRTNRVMVFGAVKMPGVYFLPRSSSDLLSALVAAGDLADDAGTNVEIRNPSGMSGAIPLDRIAVLGGIEHAGHSQSLPTGARSTPSSFRVDLVSATKGGQATSLLADGSIVMVERRDPQSVQVVGLVHKPGDIKYPIGTDMRMLDAIAQAGWTNNQGANKVYIIRNATGQGHPVVIQASIRAAERSADENLRLAPGDVVSVEQTPGTIFIDTIRLIRFAVGTSLTPLL